MEPIGQRMDDFGGVAVAPRRESRETRDLRLKPAFNEAVGRFRDAERDHDEATEALATAAAGLLLGEASEEAVKEAESAVEQAERSMRRWQAGMRALDDERGIIRSPSGEVLS